MSRRAAASNRQNRPSASDYSGCCDFTRSQQHRAQLTRPITARQWLSDGALAKPEALGNPEC